MPIPESMQGSLRIPVIAAPMFLVSTPKLVTETCGFGVVGTLPALNQRTTEGFDQWIAEIQLALGGCSNPAPFGVNLIVHSSNSRLEADLQVCRRREVPLIITSLGAAAEVVDVIHDYGGLVFHDVTTIKHARVAAAANVDGLVAVCAGAGGHGGLINPLALVQEIRSFFDGTIVLAGAISNGAQVAAAIAIGADLAYMGTRFVCTQESGASSAYRDAIVASNSSDLVYTDAISGVPANYLQQSLDRCGIDAKQLAQNGSHGRLSDVDGQLKAWKDVWSAGQGVGSIQDVPTAEQLCFRLEREFKSALAGFCQKVAPFASFDGQIP